MLRHHIEDTVHTITHSIYIWKIVKGVKNLSNILTTKPKLLLSQFSRFDLQNAKELKQ